MKTLKLPLLLKTTTVVSLFALLGCVNRGSHTDITTPGGDSGVGGSIVPPMDAARDQEPPPQDGGAPDVTFVDNCDVDGGSSDGGDAGPAPDAGPPSACTAMFSFESPSGCGLYGAALGMDTNNPANTDGFKRVYHSGNAFCGRGAMAIDVDLDGHNRLGGEVAIPINPTADYTGKTLSFAVKASVAGGSTVRLTVFLVTTRYEPKSVDLPLTTDYNKVSVVVPDMPDASAAGVIRISFEVHGQVTPYIGTVYLDEIDIRDTPDAGRSSDGPVDMGAIDARDGGASDVRDAPAGS